MLYVVVFNIGIVMGVWSGGCLLDGVGLYVNLWVVVVLVGSVLLMVVIICR